MLSSTVDVSERRMLRKKLLTYLQVSTSSCISALSSLLIKHDSAGDMNRAILVDEMSEEEEGVFLGKGLL